MRRWIPQLADWPSPLIHHPWTDPDRLAGSGYPPPMVDLADSRAAALAAYQDLKDA